jgi:hypothetical protein
LTEGIDKRSGAVEAMAKAWAVTEPLMAGTLAMRGAGKILLPQFPREPEQAYRIRLNQAVLFPAFRRTVMVMSGKPFSKPITLSEDTPPEVVEWAKDIDLEKTNLHAFCAELMIEAIAHGLCGILVDSPTIDKGTGPLTVENEKALKLRPYWVRIKHNQILGWRCEKIDGSIKFTQLRLAETGEVNDGEYGTKAVERVRVLERGKWCLYEKRDVANNKTDWILIGEGPSPTKDIPFVPLYGFRKAIGVGESPLMDLAHLNVKHWQRQSDLDVIEHSACVPILAAYGFSEMEDIAVGASTFIKSQSTDAKLEWVELKGSSIAEGKKSIEALVGQMIQAGAELLVKQPGNRTATEASNDAEANKSDLQRIVENFEDCLDTALTYTAEVAGLATGGNVTLYKDFGASLLSDASAQMILSLQQAGLITKTTAIAELQRRGTLSGDINPEQELEAVAAEGPSLGEMQDPEDLGRAEGDPARGAVI